MTAKQVQLSMAHMPVACAYQRIAAALQLEAQQLQMYKQDGAAKVLAGLLSQVDEAMDRFIRDANRLIHVASEMPSAPPAGLEVPR